MYLGNQPSAPVNETVLTLAGNASQVPFTPTAEVDSTNVQTAIVELNTEKQPIITGAASTITSSNLTAQKVMTTDANGKVGVSSVNASELSFLSGMTGSTIQVQLDGKVSKGGDVMTGLLTLSGDGTSALHAVTKQQLDTKLNLSGGTITGDLSIVSGVDEKHLIIGSSGAYLYGSPTSYGVYKAGAGHFSFNVDTGNGVFSGDVTASSDIRLKTNLEPISDALNKVCRLTGYVFDRTDINIRQTGLVAQEVQEVLPEAVRSEGEYLSVAYGNLVGLLVEAIKEQQKQIDELKAKIGE